MLLTLFGVIHTKILTQQNNMYGISFVCCYDITPRPPYLLKHFAPNSIFYNILIKSNINIQAVVFITLL